ALKLDRGVYLAADPGERREHRLAGIGAHVNEPAAYVELERVDVLLVLLVARLAVRQHRVDAAAVELAEVAADVIPHGRGVLAPHPLRVAVLYLVPGPAAVTEHVGGRVRGPVIPGETGRVGDGDRVGALPAEQQQPVRSGEPGVRTVLDDRLVREVFDHRPVADGQRFLPDGVAADIVEPGALVQPDHVTGEVHQGVAAGIAGGGIHAVHRVEPA